MKGHGTREERFHIENRMKEVVFKEVREQDGIGRGLTGVHDNSLDLEVMLWELKEKWL